MVNRTKDRKKTAVLNHLNNKSTGDYIGEIMMTSKFGRKKMVHQHYWKDGNIYRYLLMHCIVLMM